MESGSISSPDSSSSSSGSSSRYQSPSSWPTSTPSSAKRRAGRKKFRETRHPVYHGVRERNGGKWVCEVREPNKKTRIWLGTYPMPEMAARAHDVAVLALRGKSALLNFPDSKWAMPAAASTRPDDIRRAAAKAAEMHRPCSRDSAERVSGAGMGVGEATLSPTGMEDAVMTKPSPVVFFDEEAVFNMPVLLSDMAAGLLITPPAVRGGFEWDAAEVDTNLWAYEL